VHVDDEALQAALGGERLLISTAKQASFFEAWRVRHHLGRRAICRPMYMSASPPRWPEQPGKRHLSHSLNQCPCVNQGRSLAAPYRFVKRHAPARQQR
jgi:hypothetical protein